MDKIKITSKQYDELINKTTNYPIKNENIIGVSLPHFILSIYDQSLEIEYKYDTETQILKARISDTMNNETATFTTTQPIDITWGGLTLSDIVWEKGGNKNIINFYNQKRNLPDNAPDILKENSKYYHTILAMFEVVTKALLILPSVWKKETLKNNVNENTPTNRLLKAIYGNQVLLRNVYTIKSDINKAEYVFQNYAGYKCECWGVRGHIRHLKNGKEVFVKPYRKGVKKDDETAYTPKDYVC